MPPASIPAIQTTPPPPPELAEAETYLLGLTRANIRLFTGFTLILLVLTAYGIGQGLGYWEGAYIRPLQVLDKQIQFTESLIETGHASRADSINYEDLVHRRVRILEFGGPPPAGSIVVAETEFNVLGFPVLWVLALGIAYIVLYGAVVQLVHVIDAWTLPSRITIGPAAKNLCHVKFGLLVPEFPAWLKLIIQFVLILNAVMIGCSAVPAGVFVYLFSQGKAVSYDVLLPPAEFHAVLPFLVAIATTVLGFLLVTKLGILTTDKLSEIYEKTRYLQ